MGAHSTKSRTITSSLDKNKILDPEWQEHSGRIHLTKNMKSLQNKCLTEFETVAERNKAKANQNDIKLGTRCGPDMFEENHQLSNNYTSLRSTEEKPPYISNSIKLNERSTVAPKSSKVYV
jgi:hypothetical protein